MEECSAIEARERGLYQADRDTERRATYTMNIIDHQLVDIEHFIPHIYEESEKQIIKWGIQDRHIFEWAMWATEEFGELIQAINEYNYGREKSTDIIMKEGIQTVTLILKILDGLRK